MPILSILIPTYNYNVCSLVHDLIALSQKEHIEVEIIIGDDASTKADCIQQNDALEQLPNVRVLHNEHNLGRAENRNQLARESQGEWILFIDSDAQVTPEFSLQLYLTAGEHSEVVDSTILPPTRCPRQVFATNMNDVPTRSALPPSVARLLTSISPLSTSSCDAALS